IHDLCRDLGIALQGAPDILVRRTPADIRALRDLAARRPTPDSATRHPPHPAPPHPPARPQPS
ncbi:MAG: hypothetical protein ABW026_12235, partial [Microvirga sp.]